MHVHWMQLTSCLYNTKIRVSSHELQRLFVVNKNDMNCHHDGSVHILFCFPQHVQYRDVATGRVLRWTPIPCFASFNLFSFFRGYFGLFYLDLDLKYFYAVTPYTYVCTIFYNLANKPEILTLRLLHICRLIW